MNVCNHFVLIAVITDITTLRYIEILQFWGVYMRVGACVCLYVCMSYVMGVTFIIENKILFQAFFFFPSALDRRYST